MLSRWCAVRELDARHGGVLTALLLTVLSTNRDCDTDVSPEEMLQ